MARFLIDVDNENWLDDNWDNISDDEVMEAYVIDKSTEGQFYVGMTDAEITSTLFKAVHLAVVDYIKTDMDEDGFMEDESKEFDAKKVLKSAIKRYKKLMK